MSKSYIVIQQYLWCNENGGGIEYTSDCVEFDKRDKAIKHGFKMQGSDDFNIGVVEAGRLVSFDWMNKPVGESGGSAEVLAQIAEAIGLQEAAQ
ncbi:antitoxin [Citrobacter braakii]